MLDIKFVRENPEVVKQNIRNKFQDNKLELVDKVLELDKENREIKQEVEALRAERNKISKQIGALMGQGKREEAEEVKKQVAASGARIPGISAGAPRRSRFPRRPRPAAQGARGSRSPRGTRGRRRPRAVQTDSARRRAGRSMCRFGCRRSGSAVCAPRAE